MIDKYDADLSNAVWRNSTRSSASRECVEVAFLDRELVGVRDSKNRTGPALVFASRAWNAFTHSIIDGDFAS
ncbi:DUF397 domain-containing protein [Nocardia sp. CA-119907]|uniref:DUF397 domain-containing protein n=1 Tax=Nocardia sp. CA-119907 TaxID=3239973 RepID=UPI003D9576E0